MRQRRATLALPIFNEGEGIRSTLEQLRRYVIDGIVGYDWEIVVADDGSHDDSLEAVVLSAEEMHLPVLVLAHEVNHGLGSALSTIFGASRGDVIVTVDADLTYSVEYVPRLVEVWESTEAAVVVASPYAPGGTTRAVPVPLELRSRIANRYLAAMTGNGVSTFTGIVRAYDGKFARSLPPLKGGATANIAILHEAFRRQLDVVEIPAELDWTGQHSRRSRHALISRGSVEEYVSVLIDGVRLRRVARRPRHRATSDPCRGDKVVHIRDASIRATRLIAEQEICSSSDVMPLQPPVGQPPS